MLFTWDNALIAIFFLYGLAFYSMGLALWIESGRASKLRFARSMRLLAAFGFLHGIHEWMDMFDCSCHLLFGDLVLPLWFFWLRLIILITSFIALIAFGEHMLYTENGQQPQWKFVSNLLVFYGLSAVLVQYVYRMDEAGWRIGLDVLARYVLALPGVLLASRALWRQRRVFLNSKLADFVFWLNLAIGGLLFYGITQLFPAHSAVFPANLVNSNTFLLLFGFPIQVFRAALSFVIAASMIEVLRALEVESQETLRTVENEQRRLEQQRKQELEVLNAELVEAQAKTQHLLEEVQERDMQRGEMLKHITTAQEAERRRIARELHDDVGQVLTGLAMGLRGLSQIITEKPDLSVQRLHSLEGMATSAIADLRHMINDLRPPQLDDMGLIAALRSMHERLNNGNTSPQIDMQIVGEPMPMTPEIETTLYRIAQEAVTNALKYACATTIIMTLDFTNGLTLTITDDGKGFDVEKALQAQQDRTSWGLYGIMERTRLVDATLEIDSKFGAGTRLHICMPELRKQGEPNETTHSNCG